MTYSVVIPAFNAAPFIAETIGSVLAQTVPPAEIVVVDDGSTDDTAGVVERLERGIRLVRQANQGPGAATTAGVAAAGGEVLAFVDADDLWLPDKIERQLDHLDRHPDCHGVFGRMDSFSTDSAPLRVDAAVAGWSRSTLLLRADAFNRVGPMIDTPNRIGEMVAWIGRARVVGLRFDMIEEVLARRRLHSGSLSHRTPATAEGYLAAARATILARRKARRP